MTHRLAIAFPFVAAAALVAGCSAGHNLTNPGSRSPGPAQSSSSAAPAAGSRASSASKATSLTDGPMSPQQVVKLVTPSVVRIQVSGSGNGSSPFSRGSQQAQGSGTGVVLDDQGHILTNNHVVTLDSNAVAGKIQAVLSDGRTLDAKVVGRDPGTDLAVVQVNGQNMTPAKFAASGSSEVGEPVLAIGYALNLRGTPTVTSGVISATDRVIPETTTSISGAIQTDAPINPGNSGGPLVNLAGEVVGINTAGMGTNTQGIFLAISSDVAQPVVHDLISKGKIERGFIGIQTHSVTADEAKAQSLGVDYGVAVDGVQPGTPAEKAGLRSGDVIIKIGNHDIRNTGDLQQSLISEPPGNKITVSFYRGSDKKSLDVTLGSRPDNVG